MARMTRRSDNRIIAGVCGAVAEGLGVSTFATRVGFVLFGFLGVGELVYLLLWILLPRE